MGTGTDPGFGQEPSTIMGDRSLTLKDKIALFHWNGGIIIRLPRLPKFSRFSVPTFGQQPLNLSKQSLHETNNRESLFLFVFFSS